MGWLFEAPEPRRRKFLARVGLTRGETQGTSLALFYRAFLSSLLLFSFLFSFFSAAPAASKALFAAFYLAVHLMKLHAVSLMWGVTTEAMEYEEMTELREARARGEERAGEGRGEGAGKRRLAALGFVGLGGTLGQVRGRGGDRVREQLGAKFLSAFPLSYCPAALTNLCPDQSLPTD